MVKCVIGAKQSQKALDMGYALKVYIAKDAEKHVIRNIVDTAESKDIPIEWIDTMSELGQMCKIDVGAAIAVETK